VTLVLATQNIHKVQEMRSILSDWIWHLKALSELNPNFEIIEDGMTFEENARKKAEHVMQEFGYICLGEDTGLEVDALNGQPGVYSARYAGDKATYQQNVEKLLSALKDTPNQNRTARFRCVCALAFPVQYALPAKIFEGICEGMIIEKPKGDAGFGYDPVFVPRGYTQTFAELTAEQKNKISHRAKALQQVRQFLDKSVILK